MNVLSYLFYIILDHATSAPGHVHNVTDGLNDNSECYLKEKMGIFDKITSINISKIGTLPGASKYGFVNFIRTMFTIFP